MPDASSKPDSLVPVRFSHLLGHCTVGAIVRDEERLMVVCDTRYWDRKGSPLHTRELRYVDRVRRALGIAQRLRTPPICRQHSDDVWYGWIRAVRFPTWMACTQCGLLHRWAWTAQKTEDPTCLGPPPPTGDSATLDEPSTCGGRMEQVAWVIAHPEGYLADVPWHYLAHRDGRHPTQEDCQQSRERPYLRIRSDDGRRVVRCDQCHATGTFPNQLPFSPYSPQQPWMRDPPRTLPEADAHMLEVNDVRVHSARTVSALSIPPESRVRRGTVVDWLHRNPDKCEALRTAGTPLLRRSRVRTIAAELSCSDEEVDEALQQIQAGYPHYDAPIPSGGLLEDEYAALTSALVDLHQDEDLVTVHRTRGWHNRRRGLPDGPARRAAQLVHRLVEVRRLKEILILKGFSRVADEHITPPDITGDTGWLPALELHGEGIFFTLDQERLRTWEAHETVRSRAQGVREKYSSMGRQDDPPLEVSPRFLLCHTLAHLLIRQLEATAGYPAASIRERLYCSQETSMAGVLIYVATPDKEGSLGGLAEQAMPRNFLRLLERALQNADWCSLDPVCSEQDFHGPRGLNKAACHACALLPETSCAHGNTLLDRALLCGNQAMPAILDILGDPI